LDARDTKILTAQYVCTIKVFNCSEYYRNRQYRSHKCLSSNEFSGPNTRISPNHIKLAIIHQHSFPKFSGLGNRYSCNHIPHLPLKSEHQILLVSETFTISTFHTLLNSLDLDIYLTRKQTYCFDLITFSDTSQS
jgi:hypothetical protein